MTAKEEASIFSSPPVTSGDGPGSELARTLNYLSTVLGFQDPSDTIEVQLQFDKWVPPRPATTTRVWPAPPPRRSLSTNIRARWNGEYARFQKANVKDRGRAINNILVGRSLEEGVEEVPPEEARF